MSRVVLIALVLCLTVPAFAKTHKYNYDIPCSALWPATKDALRNSGKYGIIGIDSTELTASYNIGGFLGGKRINSLVLNTVATGCELQVQTSFSGVEHDDAGDLKKRIDESLAKLSPAPTAKPVTPTQN